MRLAFAGRPLVGVGLKEVVSRSVCLRLRNVELQRVVIQRCSAILVDLLRDGKWLLIQCERGLEGGHGLFEALDVERLPLRLVLSVKFRLEQLQLVLQRCLLLHRFSELAFESHRPLKPFTQCSNLLAQAFASLRLGLQVHLQTFNHSLSFVHLLLAVELNDGRQIRLLILKLTIDLVEGLLAGLVLGLKAAEHILELLDPCIFLHSQSLHLLFQVKLNLDLCLQLHLVFLAQFLHLIDLLEVVSEDLGLQGLAQIASVLGPCNLFHRLLVLAKLLLQLLVKGSLVVEVLLQGGYLVHVLLPQ